MRQSDSAVLSAGCWLPLRPHNDATRTHPVAGNRWPDLHLQQIQGSGQHRATRGGFSRHVLPRRLPDQVDRHLSRIVDVVDVVDGWMNRWAGGFVVLPNPKICLRRRPEYSGTVHSYLLRGIDDQNRPGGKVWGPGSVLNAAERENWFRCGSESSSAEFGLMRIFLGDATVSLQCRGPRGALGSSNVKAVTAANREKRHRECVCVHTVTLSFLTLSYRTTPSHHMSFWPTPKQVFLPWGHGAQFM